MMGKMGWDYKMGNDGMGSDVHAVVRLVCLPVAKRFVSSREWSEHPARKERHFGSIDAHLVGSGACAA